MWPPLRFKLRSPLIIASRACTGGLLGSSSCPATTTNREMSCECPWVRTRHATRLRFYRPASDQPLTTLKDGILRPTYHATTNDRLLTAVGTVQCSLWSCICQTLRDPVRIRTGMTSFAEKHLTIRSQGLDQIWIDSALEAQDSCLKLILNTHEQNESQPT